MQESTTNKKNKCLICGKEALPLRHFASRGSEDLDLLSCKGCGAEFLWPQPSDNWLSEEYSGYFEKRTGKNVRQKVPYFKKLLTQVKLNLANKDVLEIGPGEGDNLLAIHQIWPTANLSAIELNSESKEFFNNINCQYYNESLEQWLGSSHNVKFDYIMLFDLLEHLRDPVQALQTLVSNHLKDGGEIVATFPSVDSLSHKLLKRFWPQYKVEHLLYFSAPSVGVIEESVGLKRRELRHMAKKLPLHYLIKVGSNFGPKAIQSVVSKVERPLRMLPNVNVTLGLGEFVWVASK